MANNQQQDKRKKAPERAKATNPQSSAGITDDEITETPSHQRGIDARPTGMPNSDRHAMETAHQWEPEEKPRPDKSS
jgi:hypothetical protein